MAKFCTECGKEIAAGVAFCTECGTKTPADPVTATAETVTEVKETKVETPVIHTPPEQSYQVQQNYQQPAPTVNVPPAPDPTNKVVSTGAYFGLMLLFSLPIIGFFASIIMAFVPKNKNLKNYARAILIWTIIALVIAGLLVLLISLLLNSLTDVINQTLGEDFGGIGEVFNQFNGGGDPTGGIGSSDVSGGGGLGDLFNQFGQLSEQMEQFQNGGLPLE